MSLEDDIVKRLVDGIEKRNEELGELFCYYMKAVGGCRRALDKNGEPHQATEEDVYLAFGMKRDNEKDEAKEDKVKEEKAEKDSSMEAESGGGEEQEEESDDEDGKATMAMVRCALVRYLKNLEIVENQQKIVEAAKRCVRMSYEGKVTDELRPHAMDVLKMLEADIPEI